MVLSKEAFCFKYLQLGAARCIGWARVRSSQDVITPNSRMTYSWPSEPPLRWTAKDHSLIRQAQKRSIIRNTCIDWGQHPAFTVVEMCVLTYSYLLEARAKACLLEIWRQEKKNCTAITNILHIHAHTHGHRWAHTLFQQTTPALYGALRCAPAGNFRLDFYTDISASHVSWGWVCGPSNTVGLVTLWTEGQGIKTNYK